MTIFKKKLFSVKLYVSKSPKFAVLLELPLVWTILVRSDFMYRIK